MLKKRLEQLEKNEAYASYQAEMAFEKELNILRNDFYYQMIASNTTSLVDFMYSPLDVVSGDAYSARRIDKYRTFYLLVDGMGKGISASFTTVTITAFINHLIDKMIQNGNFTLEGIIQESMEFIRPILLEDEVLSIDYIYFDDSAQILEYAKFSMPPFLLQDREGNVTALRSNNIPLSKWSTTYTIDRYDISNTEKYLFYSDGIVENRTKYEEKTYSAFIEEDFKSSFTREEFKDKFFEKIEEQEDDLTLIFINTLDIKKETLLTKQTFASTLEAVDSATEWYESIWQNLGVAKQESYKATLVFTELYMNALEHGNLGIDAKTKHHYLEEDIYFEKLAELEKESTKKITVSVYKLEECESTYIVTEIFDEGDGFDTQVLSQIFRNSRKFNGRGVFVSRKNSMGIYYNNKGNTVLFLNKI